MAALQPELLHENLGQVGILGIEAVVDGFVDEKTVAAVGEIEPAVVDDRALLLGGQLEDGGEQLLAVGRGVNVDAELVRGGGEVGEAERIDFLEVDRLALPRGEIRGQRVERRQVGKASRLGQIAEGRREIRRWRLRRILVAAATGTARPVLAALPLVAFALLEIVRVVAAATILVAATLFAALVTTGGLLPAFVFGVGSRGGSTGVRLLRHGAGWRRFGGRLVRDMFVASRSGSRFGFRPGRHGRGGLCPIIARTTAHGLLGRGILRGGFLCGAATTRLNGRQVIAWM